MILSPWFVVDKNKTQFNMPVLPLILFIVAPLFFLSSIPNGGSVYSVVGFLLSIPILMGYFFIKSKETREKRRGIGVSYDMSRIHSLIFNDGFVVSFWSSIIFWITALFVWIFRFDCGEISTIGFSTSMCIVNLQIYSDHIVYWRSISQISFLIFTISIFASCVLCIFSFIKLKNKIKVNAFDFYSHASSGIFSLYIVVILSFIFIDLYYSGFYMWDRSSRLRNNVDLYFWFSYVFLFPVISFFSVKLFTNVLIIYAAFTQKMGEEI